MRDAAHEQVGAKTEHEEEVEDGKSSAMRRGAMCKLPADCQPVVFLGCPLGEKAFVEALEPPGLSPGDAVARQAPKLTIDRHYLVSLALRWRRWSEPLLRDC